MVDRTPGSEAVLGSLKRSSRKSASTGQLGLASIPGYTGHISGRIAENIHSVGGLEAAKLSGTARSKRGVARSDADSERTRQWRGHDILGQTIDAGSMNAAIGTSNMDGLTQVSAEHGPSCKTVSYFYNPRGHGNFRSGAAIPGYAAHIPGKYAGNVFASNFAQANLAASGVRRREGAEAGTNWLLASEFDKAAKAHGADSDMRTTIRTIGFHEGTRNEGLFRGTATKPLQKTRLPKPLRTDDHMDPRVWRLYEPSATHHKLRY